MGFENLWVTGALNDLDLSCNLFDGTFFLGIESEINSICCSKTLKSLNLSRNKLKQIAAEPNYPFSVVDLNLAQNQLNTVEFLASLKKSVLKTLRLEQNPFTVNSQASYNCAQFCATFKNLRELSLHLQDEALVRFLAKQDLPSLKYYDEAKASQAFEKFNRPSVLAAANITTLTSFNVDVSAIDNNPAA